MSRRSNKKHSYFFGRALGAFMLASLPISLGNSSLIQENPNLILVPPIDGFLSCSIFEFASRPRAVCITPDGHIQSDPALTQSVIEHYQKQLLIEELIRRNRALGAREFAV
jgi:hypothetical protein